MGRRTVLTGRRGVTDGMMDKSRKMWKEVEEAEAVISPRWGGGEEGQRSAALHKAWPYGGPWLWTTMGLAAAATSEGSKALGTGTTSEAGAQER